MEQKNDRHTQEDEKRNWFEELGWWWCCDIEKRTKEFFLKYPSYSPKKEKIKKVAKGDME